MTLSGRPAACPKTGLLPRAIADEKNDDKAVSLLGFMGPWGVSWAAAWTGAIVLPCDEADALTDAALLGGLVPAGLILLTLGILSCRSPLVDPILFRQPRYLSSLSKKIKEHPSVVLLSMLLFPILSSWIGMGIQQYREWTTCSFQAHTAAAVVGSMMNAAVILPLLFMMVKYGVLEKESRETFTLSSIVRCPPILQFSK